MNHIPQTTIRDKAIFTGIIIILIVIIAILINQYYYNSIRDNLISTDFLIAFAILDFDYGKAYIGAVSNSRGD
jgi:hypothetical protein